MLEGRDVAVSGETAQAFLRRVTRPWHDAVERAFAPFDLSTAAGLGAFLFSQARAVLSIEDALDAADIAAAVPDWETRRRGETLMADLQTLGVAVPERGPPPAMPSRQYALGCLYVLEGSRLGGRILQRQVLASLDARVRAASGFLGHHVPGGWPRLAAVLEASAGSDAERTVLRAGAEAAFALFHAAATAQDMATLTGFAAKPPLVHFAHA